jgi:hypothetical protein
MSDTPQVSPQPANDKSKFIRTYAKDVAVLAGGKSGAQVKTGVPTPPAPPIVAPPPRPASPPVRPPLPPEPSAAEREVTLERLRQKVAASGPLPPPTPVAPPPVFKASPPPPVAPSNVEEKLSPIHTYKSDFADRIDQKGATTFSVLAAQQDTQSKTPSVKKKNNLVLVGVSVALIVLGGGGLGAAVWYVMHSNILPGSPLSAPSLVFADEQIQLTGSGTELMSEIAALANEPLPEGNVLVVYLTEATTTAKGVTTETPLAGGALIKTMRLPAPDILLRNISEESTVGIVNAGGETRPFFVFGVTSYERTFAGMLAWERSMMRDLVTLYPSREGGNLTPTATSTIIGTSTPVFVEPIRPQDAFTDAIVANHDVRVLRDTAGQSLVLYGYVGKDLLILARDEAAYAALLGRLSEKE